MLIDFGQNIYPNIYWQAAALGNLTEPILGYFTGTKLVDTVTDLLLCRAEVRLS